MDLVRDEEEGWGGGEGGVSGGEGAEVGGVDSVAGEGEEAGEGLLWIVVAIIGRYGIFVLENSISKVPSPVETRLLKIRDRGCTSLTSNPHLRLPRPGWCLGGMKPHRE